MALSEAQHALRGALHLWPNGALFVGSDMVNEPHRHFTASIIVGLEGPVRVRVEPSTEWESVDAMMVAPNVEQQLDARGVKLAIFQIDPESDAYGRIAHRFTKDGGRIVEKGTVALLRAALRNLGDSNRVAFDAWTRTMNELALHGEPQKALDPRIRQALGIIKSDVLSPPPAAKLAAAIGLSPGRLIHLFTREMGLPIRRYVLWLRLRDVLISLIAGSSLTEAAHRAGFSDSAHLSRTFRGMFGFPPSTIAEGRGRVRLGFDPKLWQDEQSPHPPVDAERLARVAPPTADPAIR